MGEERARHVKEVPRFATRGPVITAGLEATRMDEQGVASVKNIDRAIEVGTTHSIGPLQLSDLVGLDVRLNNAQYLHEELGSVVSRPPKILQHLVAEGKLGKKSGQGFDQWE